NVRAVLEPGDTHTVPESALWRNDRGRFGLGGDCVEIGAGEDRGAGGDRRARYGDTEPGRQHVDGGRSRVYRGDERCAIPGVRFENGKAALGRKVGGEWTRQSDYVYGPRRTSVRSADGRRRRRVSGRRLEQYSGSFCAA